nr:MAG TPA: hypothetical protein [Caudoviricetes sp.]
MIICIKIRHGIVSISSFSNSNSIRSYIMISIIWYI